MSDPFDQIRALRARLARIEAYAAQTTGALGATSYRSTAMTMEQQSLAADPDAARLAARLDALIARLSEMPSELGSTCTSTRLEVMQYGFDSNGGQTLVPDALKTGQGEIRNRGLRAADALFAEAQSVKDQIETLIAGATAEGPEDPAAATLEELREQRAWARIVRRLDAATDPGFFARVCEDIMRELVDADDSAGLAALGSELSSYAKARGYGIPGVVQERMAETEASTMTPVGRTALRYQQVLTAGWPRLLGAFDLARRDLSGQPGAGIAILPGFMPRTQINFAADGTQSTARPSTTARHQRN